MTQLQAGLQEQQARIELAHARAAADQGLGMERASRVQENQALAVERRAKATREHEEGLLNFVKSLKEAEDIDLRQIEKLIQLAAAMKEFEQSQQPEAMPEPSAQQIPGVEINQPPAQEVPGMGR